ncbi:unnamed protein product, partial [marine sediment metagenome]
SETEDILKAELGKEVRTASIGPAGEKLSLISCIINKGRANARSGVGAVMGSKKLKAVAVIGTAKVPVANSEKVNNLRKKYVAMLKGPLADLFRNTGTCGINAASAHSGDSPVKNWGGVGISHSTLALLFTSFTYQSHSFNLVQHYHHSPLLRQGADPDYGHGATRDGEEEEEDLLKLGHDFPSTLPQEN